MLFVHAWESLEPLLRRQLRGAKPAMDAEKYREIVGRLLDAASDPPGRHRIHPREVWTALERLLERRSDAFADSQLMRVVDLQPLSYEEVVETGETGFGWLETVDRTLKPVRLRQLATAELRRRTRA